MEDEDTSLYAPYLKMLPKNFTTPSYSGQTIDPSHLPLSVREYWCTQQRDLEESWRRINEVFPNISHEKFLWAWHVVNTRCIYVENKPHASVDNSLGDTLAVVPFVDMLNHDPSAQVTTSPSSYSFCLDSILFVCMFQCLATFERYSKKYVVRASHYIQDGQQVTVCYGPHDNARLWLDFVHRFSKKTRPNRFISA
ncbi:unnamed protein product [Haemonchus placei]|uniref:SET domain-containing protein n=1 Tax=Haemonchus placei TaxID=6290 RepID=A0A158QLR1_HAEPC|nr:unnamed protein product [Haemonchus placei]